MSRYRHLLRTRSRIHEVITRNDDFTDRRSDVPRLLNKGARPLAVFIQEGKFTDYARIVPPGYRVAQVRRSRATAGVAVIYDRRRVQAVGKVRHRVLDRAPGLLPRGVTWIPLKVDGRWITFASTHRHPQRNSRDWPAFDRALRRWLASLKTDGVVLGMDTNVPGRPRRKRRELKRLARSYELRVRGVGLDAVFIGGAVRFASRVRKWRRMRSDHHPVSALIRIKRRRRRPR